MKTVSLVIAMIVLSACSSKGFNKEHLRRELQAGEKRQVVVTDEEIKKVFDLKPQLPKPFKVGVYFVDNLHRNMDLRWNSEDKQSIIKLEEELKKTGEVSKVFLINESVVGGQDLKSLRLAAAHHGADALLMISSTSATDQYVNAAALSYILLLPALFVPGTVTDALFITRAALWDVRNEYLYMAVESESMKRKKAPPIKSHVNEELAKAKSDSMNGLRAEILRMASEMSKKK